MLVPNPYFVIDTARAAGIKRALRLGITALEREAPLHPWEGRDDRVFSSSTSPRPVRRPGKPEKTGAEIHDAR